MLISAPARAGQRVFLVSMSWASDGNNAATGMVCAQDCTTQTLACVTTNTSTTVTSAALFGNIDLLMSVSGTGIPAGAYVSAITSTSQISISAAATADGTPDLTFTGKNRFTVKQEPRSTTFTQQAFTPAVAIPVSDTGQAAQFTMRATTTARLSVTYGYGL